MGDTIFARPGRRWRTSVMCVKRVCELKTAVVTTCVCVCVAVCTELSCFIRIPVSLLLGKGREGEAEDEGEKTKRERAGQSKRGKWKRGREEDVRGRMQVEHWRGRQERKGREGIDRSCSVESHHNVIWWAKAVTAADVTSPRCSISDPTKPQDLGFYCVWHQCWIFLVWTTVLNRSLWNTPVLPVIEKNNNIKRH